jgi:hypothetical protein
MPANLAACDSPHPDGKISCAEQAKRRSQKSGGTLKDRFFA